MIPRMDRLLVDALLSPRTKRAMSIYSLNTSRISLTPYTLSLSTLKVSFLGKNVNNCADWSECLGTFDIKLVFVSGVKSPARVSRRLLIHGRHCTLTEKKTKTTARY